MDKAIFLDNREYISAARASSKTGYTSDYIGQLCRAEKIPGKLIGRTWYVDSDFLTEYKNGRQFKKEKNLKVEAKENILEDSALKTENEPAEIIPQKSFKYVPITYENDDGPRLPEISKKGYYVESVRNIQPVRNKRTLKKVSALSLVLILALGINAWASPSGQLVDFVLSTTTKFLEKQNIFLSATHYNAPFRGLLPSPTHLAVNTEDPLGLRLEGKSPPSPEKQNLTSGMFANIFQPFIDLKNAIFEKLFFKATNPPAELIQIPSDDTDIITTPAPALPQEVPPPVIIQPLPPPTPPSTPAMGSSPSRSSAPISVIYTRESFNPGPLKAEILNEVRAIVTRQSDADSGRSSVTNITNVSGGSLDTSSSNSWTGEQTFLASTTLQALTATNATTSGNLYTQGNLAFDGEILPDGLTCANGEILKKSGTNNWDCASDNSAASFGFPFTTLGTGENATGTTFAFLNGFVSTASSTLASTTVSTLLSTNATSTDLHISQFFHFAGDRFDEFVGTGLQVSSGDLQTTLGTSISNSEIADADHGDFTYSGGTANIDANTIGDSELDTTAALTWTGLHQFTNASSTIFSSTIASTSQLTLSGKSHSLLSVDANGLVVASSTIGNNQLQNSSISGIALGGNLGDLTAGNSSLTFSGTYNGGTARNILLNVGNANAWTALQTFTNASSTLFSSTIASTSQFTVSGQADGCAQFSNSGRLTSTGSACGSGGSTFSFPFTTLGTGENATGTTLVFLNGFISTASSSVADLLVTGSSTIRTLFSPSATSTNLYATNFISASSTLASTSAVTLLTTRATSTDLFVSNLASTTNLRANVAAIGALTVTSCTGCGGSSFAFPFTTLGTGENATSTTLAFLNGFISTASSTLNTFTAVSATTTSATSTSLHVSGIASTTDLRANTANIGNLTVTSCTGCGGGGSFTFPFTTLGTGENATSTTLAFLNGFFSQASSTANLLRGNMWAVGTTTARWPLQIASSTAPQLVLTGDAGAGHWAFRNAGGYLHIDKAGATDFATSSISAITIDPTGNVGFGTNTPGGDFEFAGPPAGNTNFLITNTNDVDTAIVFRIAGDPETGWSLGRANTTNQFRISAHGDPGTNDRFVIDRNGSTGMGTSTPRGSILQLASSTAPQLTLLDGSTDHQGWSFRNLDGNLYIASTSPTTYATGTTPLLTLLKTGFVGINTAAPSNKLSIAGTAGAGGTLLSLQGASSANAAMEFAPLISPAWIIGTDAADGDRFKIGRSNFTGESTRLTFNHDMGVGLGTTTSRFLLQLASTTAPQLALSHNNATPWTFRSVGTHLYVDTASATSFATTTVTNFTLTAAGNVGFGTAAPSQRFESVGTNGESVTFGSGGASILGSSGNNTLLDLLPFIGTSWQIGLDAADTNKFKIGRGDYNGENVRMTFNQLQGTGMGTTTSRWLLQLSSSTAPQLTLSDGDSNHWSFRNIDGFLYFATSSPTTFATTTVSALTIGPAGGVLAGLPTGGDKGVGSINVAGDIFKNDTAYANPDYVLEIWRDGEITQFAGNPGASTYTGVLPLSEVEEYAREHLQLPRIAAARGMFERADMVLEKLEEIFVYLFDINKRLATIEGFITEAWARFNNLFVGTLHVENELCVDDVCINKDQLKALLIQAGAMTPQPAPPVPDPAPAPNPVTESPTPTEDEVGPEPEETATTTPDEVVENPPGTLEEEPQLPAEPESTPESESDPEPVEEAPEEVITEEPSESN